MVTDEHRDDMVAACRSVLMEALTILGKHRHYLVVVGGWVPPLLFGDAQHLGSIDVDLAVDWRNAPSYVYETILNELCAAGYRQTDIPNRLERDIQWHGRMYSVRVDLITGQRHDEPDASHLIVQGVPLWCAGGVEMALDNHVDVTIDGQLPGGETNRLQVRVATAAALIVMKGMALDERMKEKDAYDLYFLFAHHPRGIQGLVDEFAPMKDHPTVQESLRRIRAKYSSLDSAGPVWAARVVQESGGDYEFARRDAFERATALLGALGVDPHA